MAARLVPDGLTSGPSRGCATPPLPPKSGARTRPGRTEPALCGTTDPRPPENPPHLDSQLQLAALELVQGRRADQYRGSDPASPAV